MSHRLRGLGALVVLLVSAGWARAATVPSAESFESYANGSAIANQAGWSGEGVVTNEAAAVAAFTVYTNNPGYAAPLPAATHTQVLMIAGPVSNSVSSGTGGVVITDLLLMPAQREAAPDGSTNYQLACWVTTNDQLVIWHRDVAGGSNTWTTLSGATIKTGAWTRLTVTKAFVSSRYQVAVNGSNALSDATGWTAASGGSHPGPWFDMVQTNGCTTRLRTEGDATAYLDDLVFTNRAVRYSATTFVEAPANNGAIATTNTITLYGDTFTNTAYAAGTYFNTSGVPAGLGVWLAYLNPTQVVVTLTGNASAHTAAASTAGLGLTLRDGMFTLGAAADVAGRARTDLAVAFSNAPVVSYTPLVFAESDANDGSITNTIAVTLVGDTFTNISPLIDGTHYTVSGVPAGLGFKLERVDATNLTASLTNKATAHGSVNNTNFVLNLLDAAFTTVAATNITGATTNLAVNFFDTWALSYSTNTFTETAANNGTVSGGTITFVGKTLAGADGTNYVLGGAVTVTNVPAGLTVAIVRSGSHQATLSFGGAATSHESASSISNLTVVFHDTAFASGDAANVPGYSNGTLRVTFANAPVLAYSPTTFTETNRNDGAIGNAVTITLTGESFTNATTFVAGTHYTTSGVPAGLTLSLTHNATQVTASVTGKALAHTNANDTSMAFAFLGAAFQNVAASNIVGATTNLAFDFNNQPVISYSRTVFTELSGGVIDNITPMIISMSGNDTFTGTNGQDFVAASKIATNNLPAGLTAVITRTSDTTLSAILTGAATANANANDTNNLTFIFRDSAITLAAADQVVNYSNGTLQVDFNDSTVMVNLVPYRESFESYADGFQLVGTNGWQSVSGSGAVVTTETEAVTALTSNFSVFPLATNHTKVLRMTDTLSDEIRSAAGGKLYTDTMLYITAREEPPDGSTNHQFAFYVNTNRQPVVWQRDTSVPTNTWLTLTNAPLVTTDAWHRVTLMQDYSTTQAQLHIDGGSPLANPSGGNSFTMAGTANNYLSRLRLLGVNGSAPSYLDDVVVTTNLPASPNIAVLTNGVLLADGGTNDFGGVEVGSNAVAILTITNFGTAPLALGGIATQDLPAVFTLGAPASSSLAPGQSTTLAVTCTPTAAGNFIGSIHLTNNDVFVNSGTKTPYDITLKVMGLAPEIGVRELAGAALTNNVSTNDFGNVYVGYSRVKTYVVTNGGNWPLRLSGIATVGANAGDFAPNTNGLSASVEAGTSTTFTVTFEPLTSGVRTASLTITNNDFRASVFTIYLTGLASSNALGPFGITNMTAAGANLNLEAHAKTGRVYQVLRSSDYAQFSLLYTMSPAPGPFTFIDTNVVGKAALTSLYYRVVEQNGSVWATNDVTWALENRRVGSNQWTMMTAPVRYAQAGWNNLNSELGRQIARGLVTNFTVDTGAPGLWIYDNTSLSPTNFVLLTGVWSVASTPFSPANYPLQPGQAFWVKSSINASYSAASAFFGLTHTNAVDQRMTNDWRMFGYPYARPRGMTSIVDNQTGWGFADQGGSPSNSFDTADNMYVIQNGRAYLLWLNTNKLWYIQNTLIPATNITLNNIGAAFYRTRGTSFVWRAMQP